MSQKGCEQGTKRRRGRPRQGFETLRTALLITTRRERGENNATLRCTSRQGMSLAVVARLDWRCFHRVRTPENSVNRPYSVLLASNASVESITCGRKAICTWAAASTRRLSAPGRVAVEVGNTMLSVLEYQQVKREWRSVGMS